MSAKTYCVCGAVTEYTVVKPKFCCSCGKEFSKNFLISKKNDEEITKESSTFLESSKKDKFEPKNPVPKRAILPAPKLSEEDDDESEDVNYEEIEAQKQIWLSRIRPSDFVIKTDNNKNNLSDFFNGK